jgi:hypothetical protein
MTPEEHARMRAPRDSAEHAPDPVPALRFQAPNVATVTLICPTCGEYVQLEARFGARLTRDSDGATNLALRTRAPKVAHSCDQLTLEAAIAPAATGARVR